MYEVGTWKGDHRFQSGTYTDAAWLSSARVVRCWVKSRNERNHRLLLLILFGGCTLERLPVFNWRKEEMTSSQYGSYAQGYTRATMVGTMSRETARWS